MITAGYIPEKGDAALKSKILAALAGILILAGGYTVWAETYGPYCYGPGAYSSEVQSSQDQSQYPCGTYGPNGNGRRNFCGGPYYNRG